MTWENKRQLKTGTGELKMLSEEECKQALKSLTFAVIRNYSNTKYDCLSRKHILKSRYQRQHDMLEQVIKEFFELKVKYSKLLDDVHDYRYETHVMKMTIRNLCKHFGVKNEEELKNIYLNPPLKIEELKPNMWVCDNYWCEWFEISEVYQETKEFDILIHQNAINKKRYETIKFEENRFFTGKS